MRTKLSPTEMRELERSMAAEGGHAGNVYVRVFNIDLQPLPQADAVPPAVVDLVANIVIIPSGRFLARPLPSRCAEGLTALAMPNRRPRLIDAPPSPHGEFVQAHRVPEPTPMAPHQKPRPGDLGYQRHLHDDAFRRRFGFDQEDAA